MTRVKAVALAVSLALGVVLATGLTAGSSRMTVPGPSPAVTTSLAAADQGDLYAAVIARSARFDQGPDSGPSLRRTIAISRFICRPQRTARENAVLREHRARRTGQLAFGSSVPPPPLYLPPPSSCDVDTARRMPPELEAAILASLARIDLDAKFEDDGDGPLRGAEVRMSEIVYDSVGVLSTTADVGGSYGKSFLLQRLDGRWKVRSESLVWIN